MKQKVNFVIYSQARSGSNLLRTLLNSHPEIACNIEIFNRNRLIKNFGVFRHLLLRFPIPYICYGKRKSKKRIYGFKLHYHHLKNPRQILKSLSRKGWKIIHLERENVIKQTFSWFIAYQTNNWIKKADTPDDKNIYHIDPKEFHALVKERLVDIKLEKQIVNEFEHLKLIYEKDLYDENKWAESIGGVFKYLGVPPSNLWTKRTRTDFRPDSERIENFAEIMDYLKKNGLEVQVSKYYELTSER